MAMKNVIKRFLEKNAIESPTIAIIGDSMVDENFHVKVIKLNPEFPTQCQLSADDKPFVTSPGGAANLCYQASNFKSNIYLLSIVDEYSSKIFKDHKLNIDYSVKTTGNVPIKKRFYDGSFPLNRWDVEKPNYGDDKIDVRRNRLHQSFLDLISDKKVDIVIISDYDKGIFSEELARNIIHQCIHNNIITLVDPKCTNLKKWKKCSIFKPNSSYVMNACKGLNLPKSDIKLDSESEFLKTALECQHVVATDSGNGVYVSDYRKFIPYEELSHKRPSIMSVSGAGDTFAFFLAMAVAYKFTMEEATAIAYNASTVYIQDRYNKPITPLQLLSWVDPIGSKITTPDNILANCRGEKIVFTNGCFDAGLTRGHIECLRFANAHGGKLVVAVNSDESVRRLKGPTRPILPLEDRMNIVASLQFVDFVVSFDEDTPLTLVEKLTPAIIVKGGDYKPEDVAGHLISKVIIYPLYESISTTEKLSKLETK